MRIVGGGLVCCLALLGAGCGENKQIEPVSPMSGSGQGDQFVIVGHVDPDHVRATDYSILFVGNSHTNSHQLPTLVCRMIRFRHPDKTICAHVLGTGFLEQMANDARYKTQIDSKAWKFVVLQGQKISMSGKFDYSKREGIELATRANEAGATVYYFAEWGRKDVEGEGVRTENIYQDMATTAGVRVSPIGRAWDTATKQRPTLEMHSSDGNHTSQTGAFLTAAVLFGSITGDDPQELATFPYPNLSDDDRRFLTECAAQALKAKQP